MKAAVIGVGYLGRFHARKYAQLGLLAAIADTEREKGEECAQQLNCAYYQDYRELLEKVDLVSIAVPTILHHEISCAFLQAGIHCLVEKPMAINCNQAKEMIEVAKKNSLVLQIGYIERFNPTFKQLLNSCPSPKYISVERLLPFSNRSTDINVVLDLMIHDLDLVFHIVQSPVKDMNGKGISVLSDHIDAAHAHIIFSNGCTANINASRISQVPSCMIRVFQNDLYASANMKKQQLTVINKGKNNQLKQQTYSCAEEEDALLTEIKAFVSAVEKKTPPLVSGEDGMQTLAAAELLNDLLKERV